MASLPPWATTLNLDPVFGFLSGGSIVVAALYVLRVIFGRNSRLLLIETIAVVEDGEEVEEVVLRFQSQRRNTAAVRAAVLEELTSALRRGRLSMAELHVKEESYSEVALMSDAADLGRRQAETVYSRRPAGHGRCIVGLIYTLDVFGELRGGGFAETLAHLNFLHEQHPVEIGCLHVYFGSLDADDDGSDLLADLAEARIRVHPAVLNSL